MFFDLTFAPLVEKLAAACPRVKGWVAMTDRAHMPRRHLCRCCATRSWSTPRHDDFEWPVFDENTAASLCATRRAPPAIPRACCTPPLDRAARLRRCLPDALDLSARDVILPVVPMFHVNAWGLPYAAALVGAKLVFPGAELDGKSLYELFENGSGDDHRGRADGVARAAATTSKQNKLQLQHAEARRDRRLGLSAGDDRDLRRTSTASRCCTPGA